MLHGHVTEEEKAELYARAWVNLTASSAEGWCLTVMEAATCGTPSAALRVGGLPESIVDGETGLLADDGPALDRRRGAAGRRRRAARARMGAAARARAADVHLGAHGAGVARRCCEARPPRDRPRLRDDAVGLGDAEGGRDGRGDDGLERDRAALHGAVRAAARRDGLRLAGRADLDLRDPGGARLGAAGRRRARDRAGPARVRPAAGGDADRVAQATVDRRDRPQRGGVPAAPADLRPDLGPRGVGGGGDGADRVPVGAAVDRARGAAGPARVQAGRLVGGLRGGRAPAVRARARRRRARRDRRVPRDADLDAGDGAGAVADLLPPARPRRRAACPCGGSATWSAARGPP